MGASAEQIFISYRRDDAAGYARAIGDALALRCGAERVFIDVDDIGAGQPFDAVIARAMGASQVLLVLIGKRWRGERADGTARIDDAADPVRREVEAGLARGMRVIPLLLDGAAMPTEAQLPAALRALAGRNALELGNTRFAADIERLVAALDDGLDAGPRAAARPRRPPVWLGVGAVLAAALVVVAWLVGRVPPRGGVAAIAASTVVSVAARLAINGEWQAEVTYDWPNAHYVERFVFGGEAGELHGSAGFLGVGRGVLEGSVEPGALRFVTRSGELGAGGGSAETVHRYRARLVGDTLHFTLQTEGGASAHVPVEFVARRVGAAAAQASR